METRSTRLAKASTGSHNFGERNDKITTRSQSAIANELCNTNKGIVEKDIVCSNQATHISQKKEDTLRKILLTNTFGAWKLHVVLQDTVRLEEHLTQPNSECCLVDERRRFELELESFDSQLLLRTTNERKLQQAKSTEENKISKKQKCRVAKKEEYERNQAKDDNKTLSLTPRLLSEAKTLSGMTDLKWQCRDEFLLDLHSAHEKIGRRCKQLESKYDVHRAICVKPDCPFRMDGTLMQRLSSFVVAKYVAHNCDEIDFTSEENKKKFRSYIMQAPMKSYIPVLVPLLMQDPDIKVATIAHTLNKYVKLEPSTHVLNRLKRMTIKSLESDKQEKVDDINGIARLIASAGYHCDILSVDWDDMTTITIELDRAIHFHASNLAAKNPLMDQLPPFDQKNPDTMEKIRKIINGAQYYYGWRVYPQEFIPYLSNVIVADAAFCDGDEEGTFFGLYGCDANHKTIMLGGMKVSDNERYKTWHLFLSGLLKEHPQLDAIGIVFLVDGDKGFQQAFEELFFLAVFFFCCKHRGENFRIKFGHGAEATFNKCVKSATKPALEKKKKNYDEKSGAYAAKVEDKYQYPAASEVCLHGRVTSQSAESMMNANKMKVRHGDTSEGLLAFVNDEADRHNRSLQRVGKCQKPVPPRVLKLLQSRYDAFNPATTTISSTTTEVKFTFLSGKGRTLSRIVNLERKECTCLKWKLDEIPCGCALRAAEAAGKPWQHLLAEHDSMARWKEQYKNVLPKSTIATESLEHDDLNLDSDPKLLFPPCVRLRKGRIPLKRKKGWLENARSASTRRKTDEE